MKWHYIVSWSQWIHVIVFFNYKSWKFLSAIVFYYYVWCIAYALYICWILNIIRSTWILQNITKLSWGAKTGVMRFNFFITVNTIPFEPRRIIGLNWWGSLALAINICWNLIWQQCYRHLRHSKIISYALLTTSILLWLSIEWSKFVISICELWTIYFINICL